MQFKSKENLDFCTVTCNRVECAEGTQNLWTICLLLCTSLYLAMSLHILHVTKTQDLPCITKFVYFYCAAVAQTEKKKKFGTLHPFFKTG